MQAQKKQLKRRFTKRPNGAELSTIAENFRRAKPNEEGKRFYPVRLWINRKLLGTLLEMERGLGYSFSKSMRLLMDWADAMEWGQCSKAEAISKRVREQAHRIADNLTEAKPRKTEGKADKWHKEGGSPSKGRIAIIFYLEARHIEMLDTNRDEGRLSDKWHGKTISGANFHYILGATIGAGNAIERAKRRASGLYDHASQLKAKREETARRREGQAERKRLGRLFRGLRQAEGRPNPRPIA